MEDAQIDAALPAVQSAEPARRELRLETRTAYEGARGCAVRQAMVASPCGEMMRTS
jgi:hypothetical protein